MLVDPASSKKRAVRYLKLRLVSRQVTFTLFGPATRSLAENVAHRAGEVPQNVLLMGPAHNSKSSVRDSANRMGTAERELRHLALAMAWRPRA